MQVEHVTGFHDATRVSRSNTWSHHSAYSTMSHASSMQLDNWTPCGESGGGVETEDPQAQGSHESLPSRGPSPRVAKGTKQGADVKGTVL